MKEANLHQPIGCYAAWNMNYDERINSASGGLVTAFSMYIIEKLNGVVYGVTLDSSLKPIYQRAQNKFDILKFQGSRYVQAHVGDAFKWVKNDLEKGQFVLFIGLPCRVLALLKYLDAQYTNLITIDLVCHGACPAKYFEEEISNIIVKKKLHNIDDVRFRSNDKNNYHLTLWSSNKIAYSKPAKKQFYFLGFLKGITLGQKCYDCAFQTHKRIGDISAGDFIGLGNDAPFQFDTKNVSLILTNTINGQAFFENTTSFFTNIRYVNRPVSEAIQYGPSLNGNAPRNKARNQNFLMRYHKYGFYKAVRITLAGEMLHNAIVTGYRCFHHFLHQLKMKIK